MAEFTDLTLTNIGYALQIKAQGGTKLQFTRVALGNGVLPSGTQLNTLTALISEKQSSAISNLSVGGKSVQIKANFSNKNLTENYYLRELGIFANDPDQGEILYAVANAGDAADYMPAYDGAETIEQVFTIDLSVGNAANVTAIFAESIYVLKAGDTMTGPLILSGDPSTDLEAATKGYIDNLIKEAVNKADPLGVCKEFYDVELPERHLWANGGTIGDESSGATGRANDDVIDLFKVLWKSVNNGGQIKLYDSAGAVVEKGTDAATDFANHMQISLPDKRGRVGIGLDNMGGTLANVVMNADADILGATGGEENHTLSTVELVNHSHLEIVRGHNVATGSSTSTSDGSFIIEGGTSIRTGSNTSTENYVYYYGTGMQYTSSAGGSGAHNNMQPWLACNYIMRY